MLVLANLASQGLYTSMGGGEGGGAKDPGLRDWVLACVTDCITVPLAYILTLFLRMVRVQCIIRVAYHYRYPISRTKLGDCKKQT